MVKLTVINLLVHKISVVLLFHRRLKWRLGEEKRRDISGVIEQFAGPLGLAGNVRPAFQGQSAGAVNYAVGGARARKYKDYVNLPDQVAAFLRDFNGAAPSDALYVVEIGANDIRDAWRALAAGADGGAVIADALTAVGNNIGALCAAGARKFLGLECA